MAKKRASGDTADAAALRARAQELLRTMPPDMPTPDFRTLVHELSVYQTELELQNEELRQAQLELAQSRDRYADLYDFAPLAYVTLNREGRVIEANLAAATLLGVERKSLVGANIARWLDRDAQDKCYLHRQAVLSGDGRQSCKVNMHAPDGTSLAVRVESIAFDAGDERLCRTVLIDVTSAQHARHQLEESERRYHRLTDAVTDYVYRVQVHHGRAVKTIHGANCEAVTGYAPDEFRANSMLWITMVPPEHRPIVEQLAARVLSDQDAPPIEHRIQRKDGQIRWVLNTVSPQHDEHGQLIAYDGLLRDITERKDAQAVVAQLNETLEQRVSDQTREVKLLAQAMASLGEGVLITTDHFDWPGPEIVYVNDAMCRITGYTADELIGQTPRILRGDRTDQKAIDLLKYELSQQRSHICELVKYRKDGTPYDAEVFVTPLFDASGNHTNYIVIHRDITERKKAEDALRLANEFNESLIATARTIVLVLDTDGRIVQFNPYMEELSGWRLEEVRGRDWFDTLIPQQQRARIRLLFKDAIKGERTRGYVNAIVTRDGQPRDIEWHDAPLTSADGRLMGLLCTGQDITERNAAAQVLRDREERIRTILDTAADAIITIDQRGIIDGVNPATERLFGFTEGELVGRNVKMLMPSPYQDEHDGYIARYLKTGEARIIGSGREVIARHKDGSTFSIDLAVSEMDHFGRFTGIVRDISVRKRLEREVLDIAASEQQRIGQDLHDGLGQELTGLGMTADTLATTLSRQGRTDMEQDLARRLVDGLKQSVTHVRGLAYGLVPVEVAAHGLMDALSGLATRIRDLEKVECSFEYPDPVPVDDNQIATHLYRIAQEACSNAIRHGSAQHIRLTLAKTDRLCTLAIHDDGCGFVLTPGGTPPTGLGLQTMQYRASQIGARLTIESADSGGTIVACHVQIDSSPS